MDKSIRELRYDLAMASSIVSVLYDASLGNTPKNNIPTSIMDAFKSNYGILLMQGSQSMINFKQEIADLERRILDIKPSTR